MRRQKAFTVVEMLIVVAIIMLLLAMLLPLLDKIRRQAQVTAQKADFAAIAAGLDAYKNDFGWYPYYKAQSTPLSLGDYLLGRMYSSGIRVGTDNSDPNNIKSVGRSYGPYLQREKWKIWEMGQPGGSLRHLLDRWGGPIAYFPRRMGPAAGNRILGGRYGSHSTTFLNRLPNGNQDNIGDNQFAFDDGWSYFLTHASSYYFTQTRQFSIAGVAFAVLVRMGDDDSSGYIDLDRGERLRFDGPYVLASGGPDGVNKQIDPKGVAMNWGFEDFDPDLDGNVDPPMVDMSRWYTSGGVKYYRYCIPEEARKRIDKSDDIYNFER